MTTQYKPPLAVHIIWHPSDEKSVGPILGALSTHLARDIDRPFSRNLNIPLFFYSSENPNTAPCNSPEKVASRNILFVFTSSNTVGRKTWKNYMDDLTLSNTMRAVPVALAPEGLAQGIQGSLKNLNFIRAYEWPTDSLEQRAIVTLAHEIYRHGFVEIEEGDKGKSSSIKIFLSHAKAGDTGRLHAKAIKEFIDNTNMSHFFDTTEISPGFEFDQEIIKHIRDSTMVCIGSDAYSSRYWCQREMLCAKDHHRPIIAVDCLEDYEDRIFPDGSNVPCIHVAPDTPLGESDILRVLTAAILETIRHHHSLESLAYYQSRGWIDSKCEPSARPPEIRQVLSLKKQGKTKICYPEPPIYSEESDWHGPLEVHAFTPLWNMSEMDSLHGLRVGISISDVPAEGYYRHHLPTDQSKRLAQDLSRHLLARAATLLYGGDLRKDGFTQFILDEAVALKNRLNTESVHVENHLAWPIHKADLEMTVWRAKYVSVMETVEYDAPDDIAGDIDEEEFLPPSTAQNKYYWSRSLTHMRRGTVASSHARVCAGGKLSGYNGKMPGILEEILIAIDKEKPIYLLGAFGGVVGEVCKALRHEEPYPEPLTEEWQISHNAGYADLQEIAREIAQDRGGHAADYTKTKAILDSADLSTISRAAGLDESAYLRLMETPFVDECVHIIMRGLKKILAKLRLKPTRHDSALVKQNQRFGKLDP
uniref:TIR domain-containing protein n=1 Tax=Candidatus Kentrum sp. UNK TaxID=2126344 RepID=A0A451B157_9GAMM|nr:MAG: TIR domain-containing protein [Candidatus Kentron sp. UNK]VFK72019.1 MAG: TIR domain-containing protein [Candidatus Kentron sp. UNK]